MGSPDILDLDAFVALHPWPEDLQRRGKHLEWLWYHDLEVDAADLWAQVIDTSRFNRALGLPEMKFEERDGMLWGEIRLGGLRQVWVEEPWEWVSCQWMQNVRRYSHGPFEVGRGVFRFQSLEPGRVRCYVYFGWIPRGFIGTLLLRIGVPGFQRDVARVMADLEKTIRASRQARPLSLSAPAEMPPETQGRIRAIRAALREHLGEMPADPGGTDVLDRLIEYVTQGDELELYRIQVPALAREWGVKESELLRLCLYATREGLLNMSWDVICPHCRGVRQEAPSLGNIPALGACTVCAIDFTTDKENAVEITFHVHPSIRAIPKRFFCSAEPALKQHVLVQKQMPPHSEVTVTPHLGPGRYRLVRKGQTRYDFLEIGDGGAVETATWHVGTAGDIHAGEHATLVLHNDTDEPARVSIETAQWNDLALRPARLFNLQEFRDLFAEEYLAGDVQLAVGEQTILFTDMVGSTRFYASRGDPAAFVEIKKHFTEVYAIVGEHDGAVVKTIGDAVMGAFGSALDAVKAAGQIHACFHKDREDTPIRLRISINTGPCIAVNLNSGIDYFGNTVNMAAKLQACAGAGDIAMSTAVVESPGVREHLSGQGATLETTEYRSEALGEAIPVLRWATFSS